MYRALFQAPLTPVWCVLAISVWLMAFSATKPVVQARDPDAGDTSEDTVSEVTEDPTDNGGGEAPTPALHVAQLAVNPFARPSYTLADIEVLRQYIQVTCAHPWALNAALEQLLQNIDAQHIYSFDNVYRANPGRKPQYEKYKEELRNIIRVVKYALQPTNTHNAAKIQNWIHEHLADTLAGTLITAKEAAKELWDGEPYDVPSTLSASSGNVHGIFRRMEGNIAERDAAEATDKTELSTFASQPGTPLNSDHSGTPTEATISHPARFGDSEGSSSSQQPFSATDSKSANPDEIALQLVFATVLAFTSPKFTLADVEFLRDYLKAAQVPAWVRQRALEQLAMNLKKQHGDIMEGTPECAHVQNSNYQEIVKQLWNMVHQGLQWLQQSEDTSEEEGSEASSVEERLIRISDKLAEVFRAAKTEETQSQLAYDIVYAFQSPLYTNMDVAKLREYLEISKAFPWVRMHALRMLVTNIKLQHEACVQSGRNANPKYPEYRAELEKVVGTINRGLSPAAPGVEDNAQLMEQRVLALADPVAEGLKAAKVPARDIWEEDQSEVPTFSLNPKKVSRMFNRLAGVEDPSTEPEEDDTTGGSEASGFDSTPFTNSEGTQTEATIDSHPTQFPESPEAPPQPLVPSQQFLGTAPGSRAPDNRGHVKFRRPDEGQLSQITFRREPSNDDVQRAHTNPESEQTATSTGKSTESKGKGKSESSPKLFAKGLKSFLVPKRK